MKTKIILEIGCNHQGSLDIAKMLINDAWKLGAWAVKFQKRDVESMPDSEKIRPRSLLNSFGKNYYEHRKHLELSLSQLEELKNYAHSKKLKFICSAFDKKSINNLISINCDYIKLPSQFYSNEEMKKILLHKNIKTIVSTGMHNLKEIISNSWITSADIIMHCISVYPAKIKQLQLDVIRQLTQCRKNIGYSSHDINGRGIKYAVLCGAKYIERHFTACKVWKGHDHQSVSSDFKEIENIIKEIEEIEEILGDGKIELSNDEAITKRVYRK